MLKTLRRVKELQQYHLRALNGEFGAIEDFFFDDRAWTARYFIVNTGGWLGGRKVLISPAAITAVNEQDKVLEVGHTKEQIELSPPMEADKPVSRQYEEQFHRYYKWSFYWELMETLAPDKPPTDPAISLEQSQRGDPCLRSVQEVAGYRIGAIEDEIGHVEDFIVEDHSWAVRYLEIDTRNWLPGKKVLVAPTWVATINWAERRVQVSLPRAAIESAPAYDPSRLISREYEVKLFKHYGHPGYWS